MRVKNDRSVEIVKLECHQNIQVLKERVMLPASSHRIKLIVCRRGIRVPQNKSANYFQQLNNVISAVYECSL